MKDNIPTHYPCCFNSHCVRKSQCLRYLAGENIDPDAYALLIINPKTIPADTSTCTYFHAIRTKRLAWGVKNLLNKVPYKDGVYMRRQLISYFGKTTYYRFYRMESPLGPEDQKFIKQLFREQGIDAEPEYEKFTESYDFN